MIRSQHLFRDTRGAAALEFALVALPFILLLIGLLEFGRSLYIRNALDSAADRAQRVILIDPSADEDSIETVVRASFSQGQPDDLIVSYSKETVASANYGRVLLKYEMMLLLPVPLGRTVIVTSSRLVALP